MVDIAELYRVMGRFVIGTLNDPSINVYPSNTDITRLPKPIVTMFLHNFNQLSFPIHGEIDEVGIQNKAICFSFTAEFKAYADELHRSESILMNLYSNVGLPKSKTEYFKDVMFFLKTLTPVRSIPISIGGIKESQAILELGFYTYFTVTEDVGLIETVEITNEDTGNVIIASRS